MLMRKLWWWDRCCYACLRACCSGGWTRFPGWAFFQFALKGILLGVGLALMLPVGGISHRNTGWLFAAAGLLLATLTLQYLETVGKLNWALLRAVINRKRAGGAGGKHGGGVSDLTAALNLKHRS